MNLPRLSIIMATYNAASTLERCLDSVFSQDFVDWELLIADGASSDSTVQLIEARAPRIAWWQSLKDRGIYDAWNQALEAAQGEYVIFLGADDAFHASDTLSKIFDAIGRQSFDLVTGRGMLVNRSGRAVAQFGGAWSYGKVARRMTICHPGALHRRELFKLYGNFNIEYKLAADYDFILRLPKELRSKHLNFIFADIADGGLSRKRRWLALRERFFAQANCPRVGKLRAGIYFMDKLWRIPVARLLGIPN